MNDEKENAVTADSEAVKLRELEHALRNNLHAIACGIKILQRNPSDTERLSMILETIQKEHSSASAVSDELFKILRNK